MDLLEHKIDNIDEEVAEARLRHLPRAIALGNRVDRVDRLAHILLAFDFLHKKVERIGVRELISDFATPIATNHKALHAVHTALLAAEPALIRDPSQLAAQLLGRLTPSPFGGLESLLGAARAWRARCWLRPISPSLAGREMPGQLRFENLPTINGLAAAPNGQCLTAFADGRIQLWELRSGQILDSWEVPGRAECVAADSQGRHAVIGTDQGVVHVWNLETGRISRSFQVHDWEISNVALVLGGDRGISASLDGTIALWEPHSGNVLATMHGHDGWVSSLGSHTERPLYSIGGHGRQYPCLGSSQSPIGHCARPVSAVGQCRRRFRGRRMGRERRRRGYGPTLGPTADVSSSGVFGPLFICDGRCLH